MVLVQLLLCATVYSTLSMKRHTALIPFSKFHRSCLFLSLVTQHNAPQVKGYPTEINEKIRYAVTFYHRQLLPHFIQEEKVWNYASKQTPKLKALIETLQMEREVLKESFSLLEKTLKTDALYKMSKLLEEHIRKEERQLFQLMQSELSEEQLLKIAHFEA